MELTKQSIKDLRSKLAEWRTPCELQAACVQIRDVIDGETLFNKGGLTFITEAIVAADFGAARDALLVRLIPEPEERPDFELTFGDRIERFEMVQADEKGRRRGDEYAARAKLPAGSVIHINSPLPDEIVEMVRAAAYKKAKSYPARTQLLIYLNASRFQSDEVLLESFPEAVSVARPFFSAIWITWQGTPHQITLVT